MARDAGIPRIPLEKRDKKLGYCSPLRREIWDRDKGHCVLCGSEVRGKLDKYDRSDCIGEIDHIVPLSRGGRTEADNLRLLCKRCNRTKWIRDQ